MPNTTTEPDFEIRNLSEYESKDLEKLFDVVYGGYVKAKTFEQLDDAQYFDIWLYRIKDAIKEAKKRENS